MCKDCEVRDKVSKEYTVNIIFNKDGSKVLLQLKDRTKFRGMYNGIGGKIEYNESPGESAVREIEEESGIVLTTSDLRWLGTLHLPYDCTSEVDNSTCVLYFYGTVVKNEVINKPESATEELRWFSIDDVINHRDVKLAGNGDVEYFIGIGHTLIFKSEEYLYK